MTHRVIRPLGLGVAVVGALGLIVGAVASSGGPIEIEIRDSRFAPATLTVPVGVPVTIVLRNEDPIDHEWIVGTEELHERHRTGTEPVHDSRPTEVSVPALSSRTTTVTFDTPGSLRFVCHLPGHEAYGMVGLVRVTDG
jgi:uncharacterized cupredoxin-like copper-binding protein